MISVIVPYVKDRGFLSKCLQSINTQTYSDFEVILSKSDGSLPVNFNNGLRRAKGEFIKMGLPCVALGMAAVTLRHPG
jgi:glycosyltransferase involved in cell wall biosynthesis